MSDQQSRPSCMHITIPKPSLRREYTASPPRVLLATPSTPSGLIPLGSPRITPIVQDSTEQSLQTDCFAPIETQSSLFSSFSLYEAHGFIPLCSVALEEPRDDANDYFSLPASDSLSRETFLDDERLLDEEPRLSPNPVPYVAHGFIPLCSVALEQPEEYVEDYFSLPIEPVSASKTPAKKPKLFPTPGYWRKEDDPSPVTLLCSLATEKPDETMDYFSFPTNRPFPPKTPAGTPQLYFGGFRHTYHKGINSLTHPTGSPLRGREIIPEFERLRSPDLTPLPKMPGGDLTP
ncbi:hypothetical protein P153DRAFT_367338 [Dothidotthia symphoricarpi CBS 119687]|uniref:Uncharacterized protein n=1 Tax=Dothidotthia symphoricarpi CBS 119687 TaxID=1392245 RepID=A0A6A6ADM2_9PLEO|nr:uncharacterized protein P153DRAFT_367338 [Dothidotthia symphoricarpi CBS 119687]KAF2129054.1 hypothetical protein P153DRAFT_367338 [Dothidotthia symphoricarpi CBS 119687]